MLPGFFSAPMRSMLLVERMEGPLHKLARLIGSEFSLRTISRLRRRAASAALLCAVLQFLHRGNRIFLERSPGEPCKPVRRMDFDDIPHCLFQDDAATLFLLIECIYSQYRRQFFSILLDSYAPHPCREAKIGHTPFPVEERAWPYIIKSCRRSEKSPLKTPALRHFHIRGHRLDWPTLRFVRHEDCRFRMTL